MNLAIRGIEANRGSNRQIAHRDLHPDLKADYILANPPFNVSDWSASCCEMTFVGNSEFRNRNANCLDSALHTPSSSANGREVARLDSLGQRFAINCQRWRRGYPQEHSRGRPCGLYHRHATTAIPNHRHSRLLVVHHSGQDGQELERRGRDRRENAIHRRAPDGEYGNTDAEEYCRA